MVQIIYNQFQPKINLYQYNEFLLYLHLEIFYNISFLTSFENPSIMMFIGVEQHVFIFFHIYEKLLKRVGIFLHPTQKIMLRRQEMHKISMQMMMVFMQTTSSHNTYFWQTQLIARLQFGSNLKCTNIDKILKPSIQKIQHSRLVHRISGF